MDVISEAEYYLPEMELHQSHVPVTVLPNSHEVGLLGLTRRDNQRT